MAETLTTLADLPAAVIPALGETWALHPGKPASLLAAGRPDASELTTSRDWISNLAALRQEMEEKLSTRSSNQDREKLLAALRRALDEVH